MKIVVLSGVITLTIVAVVAGVCRGIYRAVMEDVAMKKRLKELEDED